VIVKAKEYLKTNTEFCTSSPCPPMSYCWCRQEKQFLDAPSPAVVEPASKGNADCLNLGDSLVKPAVVGGEAETETQRLNRVLGDLRDCVVVECNTAAIEIAAALREVTR